MANASNAHLRLVYSASDSGTKTTPLPSTAMESVARAFDDIEVIKNTQKEILNLVLENNKTITFNPKTLLATSGNYIYQSGIPITSSNYILSTFLTNTETSYLDNKSINEANLSTGVPLHLILELGGAILGTICVVSLLMWIDSSVPLLNPILSLIGLIASPFFYAMGRVSRKDQQ